jgi:hypothetical protein
METSELTQRGQEMLKRLMASDVAALVEVQAEIQRVGWNQAIKAAAKAAQASWMEGQSPRQTAHIAKVILELLRPPSKKSS